MSSALTVINHDRDSAHLTYVYPVVSRRARGVSVGVNLNPNNTCNFRCIYCQVPGLVAGNEPPVDVPLLERELRSFLGQVLHGSFMQQRVPEGSRRLNDVAFSGNGEPTTSPNFGAAVQAVGSVLRELDLLGKIRIILITNGSRTDRPKVAAAIEELANLGGEVWFKLDAATQQGAQLVNSSSAPLAARLQRLEQVAQLCPTWVQSCFFAIDGHPPPEHEVDAYVQTLENMVSEGVPLRGVLLYGLARPSHQPEAPRLERLDEAWLTALARRLEAVGLTTQVSV